MFHDKRSPLRRVSLFIAPVGPSFTLRSTLNSVRSHVLKRLLNTHKRVRAMATFPGMGIIPFLDLWSWEEAIVNGK